MHRLNPGRRALVGAIAVFALVAPGVAAACTTWDAGRLRTIEQSNGITVYGTWRQSGASVGGTAAWTEIRRDAGEDVGIGHNGGIQGTVDGSRFEAVITWDNGSIGVYSGQIAPDGRVSGINYDRRRPDIKVSWYGVEPLGCADLPPKVTGLGKRTPTPPPSAVAAQAHGLGIPGATLGTVAEPPSSAAAARAVQRTSPDTCVSGYVWRLARDGDLACVTPASRDLAIAENRTAPERWNPAGAYGPSTCTSGYVWREAYAGDAVCVTPERREAVRAENRAAPERRVGP